MEETLRQIKQRVGGIAACTQHPRMADSLQLAADVAGERDDACAGKDKGHRHVMVKNAQNPLLLSMAPQTDGTGDSWTLCECAWCVLLCL